MVIFSIYEAVKNKYYTFENLMQLKRKNEIGLPCFVLNCKASFRVRHNEFLLRVYGSSR